MTLAWTPSTDTNVVGYRVYYGVASRSYTNVVDVGSATSASISNLVEGVTYYFAATAYNVLGMESDYSNETSYTVPGAAGNQTPTLNALNNLTINEDSGLRTVNLSGISSGATNESQTLMVTASSSNTGLIPTPTVSYTSPNATGTLTFTPVANANGSATVSVSVNDGGASNNIITRTFTVTVNSVNDVPVLNAINNLSLNQNAGQQTVNLAGISSGAANENQTLVVSASSSNTGLVPTPTVTYTSPNATGTLRFTPVSGASGSATVTVTVNDGGASNNIVTRTFTVTVNVSPTISAIPSQTISTNSSTGPIAFSVSDAETAAGSLTLSASSSAASLIPTGNIVFGGTGGSRTVTLTPLPGMSGTANITVTVSDGSATASSSFQLSVLANPTPPVNLLIITNGSGIITPQLNSASLQMGKTYTLTAVPAAGYEFAGWSGSIVSSDPRLSFMMTSNLVLQANFVPSPFAPLAGSYNGLFYETNEVQLAKSGSFTITVNTKGTYTGRLQLGAKRHSFKGKLNLQCRATNVIVRKGLTPLFLDLRLGTNTVEADQAIGRVTNDTFVAQLLGDRAVFNSKTNPPPWTGKYTLLVPGLGAGASVPSGNGFGCVRVDANGKVRLAGTLADGTKFSQSTVLSKNGEWPLYAALYSGSGSVLSWLTLSNQAGSDLSGSLSWIKSPNAKARYYSGGFTGVCDAVGSSYIAPVGSNLVDVTSGHVEFSGGDLGSGFTNLVTLALNKVLNTSTNQLTMSFSLSTGAFKGKVTDPSSARNFSFSGAVLQKMDAGYGFLLGTNECSRVAFEE